MKVAVVGNCVTATYSEVLKATFPSWDVRRVDIGSAEKWLTTEQKPEFNRYLQVCDLFVGNPIRFEPLAAAVNPSADQIIIPPLVFRGLHPDIAIVPNLKSIFGASQTSLIAVGASALGLEISECLKLYNETVYAALGLFGNHPVDIP
jgi:hypothetical protein